MKHLLVILTLLPTILFSQTYGVEVFNTSKVEKIEDRNVTFGVKENVEEILSNNGLEISNTPLKIITVTITKIESPQQILNILGTKWLKKSYIVEVTSKSNNINYTATGSRNTFLFAAFLDVENNEIPLNRKAFSKALESAIKNNIKQIK
jgi:translation elongation factor EF-Tu-like GTPase